MVVLSSHVFVPIVSGLEVACPNTNCSHIMLNNFEEQAITRASTTGINGVIFDRPHLKALHLCIPVRNIISYMAVNGISAFPVCFINPQLCGRSCPYKGHNRDALEKQPKTDRPANQITIRGEVQRKSPICPASRHYWIHWTRPLTTM